MLYERFWKWITRYERRHCKHENEVNTGKTKIEFGYFDECYEYDIFKCTNCNRKKKRSKLKERSGTYIYF